MIYAPTYCPGSECDPCGAIPYKISANGSLPTTTDAFNGVIIPVQVYATLTWIDGDRNPQSTTVSFGGSGVYPGEWTAVGLYNFPRQDYSVTGTAIAIYELGPFDRTLLPAPITSISISL